MPDVIIYRHEIDCRYEPAKEGGYTCFFFVESFSRPAISALETIEEAKANLADALKLA